MRRTYVAFAVVLTVVILASYYAYLRRAWRAQKEEELEMKPLWHFSSRSYGGLQWNSGGKFKRAELPESSALYGRIVQLVEGYGGRNCSDHSPVFVKGIDVIRNEDLITQFETSLNIKEEELLDGDPAVFRKSEPEVVGGDKQKRAVLERAKDNRQRSATLLNEDCDDRLVPLYVTLHGCSEKAADSICALGAKDLRRTDPGYAGAGIYTTFQAEYAALYSKGAESSVILLCCCAASNIYPISRSSDYEKPHDLEYYGPRGAAHSRFYDTKNEHEGGGMALKSGFDAHWFCVAQPHRNSVADVECYIPDDDRFPPCYDELVVKEQNQVLPIAVVRIGRRVR